MVGDRAGAQEEQQPQGGSGRGTGLNSFGGSTPQGQGRGRGQMNFRTQFNLMGTQVRIVGGPHKGMLGELRAIYGPDALVLVSALSKEIRFPRTQIRLKNSEDSEAVQRFFKPPRGDSRGSHS